MHNYFNYFTEIEEHYQQRRGAGLLLSTLDWALIETWKDAGIPLEAALRGIDETFDKYDRKPARAKTRKINSLAYCSQAVLGAADHMKEAATGAARKADAADAGFEEPRVRSFLAANARTVPSSSEVGIETSTAFLHSWSTSTRRSSMPNVSATLRSCSCASENGFSRR